MVRLRALLLLVIVLPACGTGQLANTTAPVPSPTALGKVTVPLATPPSLRPTPTVPMSTPTPLPPSPMAAATPTATALPAPHWSLVLQLLRDGEVIAEGATMQELAVYQAEIEREPNRYGLRVLVSDGRQTAELFLNDPLPFALLHSIGIAYISDLHGDGQPEVIVSDFTGGAHCCTHYHIFASDASGIRLLDALDLGSGRLEQVDDLDGDGVPELLASDDRLALVDDLAMAETPFLPLVLCLAEDNTVRDCTTQFSGLIEQSAARYEEMMANPENDELLRRAAAVGVYAHYARLGRPQEGLYRIVTRCLDCVGFVEQYRAEINERVRAARPYHLEPRR